MGSGQGKIDGELVAAAAGGDRHAFSALLERHYGSIHRLAWQITGSRADADDIAQDVCCTLVSRIGDFRGEARFSTWLYAIVIHQCRAHHRRRSAIRRLAQGLETLVRSSAGSDGRDAYDAAWLKSAIARLKPELRETLALVVGEQLTHREAAEVLGVAEKTISWRMHAARRLLAGTGPNEA
jgi:RNA polymerase sigma-70 factor (ECF subfamily)